MFTKIDEYFIPFILIIVACIQIYNSQFNGLSPWKGAGFGMFSTNEKNEINAIGYLENGDSILIRVKGSKYNVPISTPLVNTINQFPKELLLDQLSKQLLKAHFKPDTSILEPNYIDAVSYSKLQGNAKFYSTIYRPILYQNEANITKDRALKINRIKLMVFKSNYYDEGYYFKKKFIKEIIRN